jgi:hypothetical protein
VRQSNSYSASSNASDAKEGYIRSVRSSVPNAPVCGFFLSADEPLGEVPTLADRWSTSSIGRVAWAGVRETVHIYGVQKYERK